MKISYWIFGNLSRKRIEEQKDSPHKMKTGADKIKSFCILNTLNRIKRLWLAINVLKYKLGVKSIQNARARVVRDLFGKEIIGKNPVFSENQIAEIQSKHGLYFIIIASFTAAETFLYYLTASLFVPGASQIVKVVVSAFFAVLFMLGLGYSFEKHFLYGEALERHERKELSDHQLKQYKEVRLLCHILIVCTFIAIVFCGLARIFFLESIPAKGMDAHRLHQVELSSNMMSVATMFLTILTAFLMALIKQEQVKLGVRYKVYRAWHLALKSRNKYSRDVIRAAKSLIHTVEQNVEVYWQLILDLKQIYKDELEHDERFTHLNNEYIERASHEGFTVTADIYRKFSPIQCVHEELFKYGILHDKHIEEKIETARMILSIPEEHIAEHLQILAQREKESPTASSSNGHSTSIFHHLNNKVMKHITFFVLLLAAFGAVSCTSHEKKQGKNIVILHDISDSQRKQSLQFSLKAVMEYIFPFLGKEERLICLPIDRGSQTSATEIFRWDFRKGVYDNEYAGLQQEEFSKEMLQDSIRMATDRFTRAFEKAIEDRKQFAHGTDIFGALEQARLYFDSSAESNILIIFSDMMQHMPGFNFDDSLNTENDISKFQLFSDKPDLTGLNVIILTGEQKQITPKKYKLVKSFWEQYFADCHVSSLEYSSGAVSKLEEQLRGGK